MKGVRRWLVTTGLALGLVSVATPAAAGPYALVGDAQLRQDVELLYAAHLIRGPIDSWPLPWAQIDAGLDAAHDGRVLDPYLAAAVARLDRLSALAAKPFGVEANIAATNNVSVARDFGTLTRGKFDGSAAVEYNSDVVSIGGGAGYRTNQNGKSYHFEPSQVVIRMGNWSLYGGYTEEWFGPGQDGALIYSNSARPFPKIGIKRLVPKPIDVPVLRWLGPFRIDFFGGVLNEKRIDTYDNPLVFGTRISFEPAPGFEIGINRNQVLCGSGRPCGLKQFVKSFIGIGNADNPTPGDEQAFFSQAGDQRAGYGMSYTHRFGRLSGKFYFDLMGEDEQHILIEQYSRQIGTMWQGPWGSGGASFKAYVEYTDTYAVQLFHSTFLQHVFTSNDTYPLSTYNNSLYFSGYLYDGRPIGFWTGGDSDDLVASLAVTDTRNRRWYGSARRVHLNITNYGNPPVYFPDPYGNPRGPVSQPISHDTEDLGIFTAGVELPTRIGDVRLEARYQTDSPNTPGVKEDRVAFEIQLRQRF